MLHRDSLGCVQRIEPGAINWMTAGRGIVHSERRPPDLRRATYTAHGLQLWAALPREFEETAPTFAHTAADAIPAWTQQGAHLRLLIGEAFGRRSPVATFAPTLYLDVAALPGAALELPAFDAAFERAVYSVDEPLAIDGAEVPAHTMAILAPGAPATVGRAAGRALRRRRRRAARWSARHLVELRVVEPRAHRAREGRVDEPEHGRGPWRARVDSAALDAGAPLAGVRRSDCIKDR